MRSKSTMTTATLHGEKGWGVYLAKNFLEEKKTQSSGPAIPPSIDKFSF